VAVTTEASDGPGKGYRWVRLGETLEKSDEYFGSGGWKETGAHGQACKYCPQYRRRTTPADAVPDDAGRRLVNGEPMNAAEMRHALGVARQDVARLTAERDAAIRERDQEKQKLREYEHMVMTGRSEQHDRLVAERDAALAEVERHRMTSEEREAVKEGIWACEDITYGRGANQAEADTLRKYLNRTREVE
jgi:hypothetical protein